jgi:hypothetical protein
MAQREREGERAAGAENKDNVVNSLRFARFSFTVRLDYPTLGLNSENQTKSTKKNLKSASKVQSEQGRERETDDCVSVRGRGRKLKS